MTAAGPAGVFPDGNPVIEASRLGVATPTGRWLARGLDFRVGPGEILHIAGPNGSGKSTLLQILIGVLKPREGFARIRSAPSSLGVLPQLQGTSLHLPMRLGDVIESAVGRRVPMGEISRVGLMAAGSLSLAWNTASGGERKRALLTRLLLRRPRVLILDEPLNHLDRESRPEVARAIVRYLQEDPGRTAVFVSHDSTLEEEIGGFRRHVVRLGS